MYAGRAQFNEYNGEVKMAERLAKSAGFSFGCIGLIDCTKRRLVDAWIGRGVPDQSMNARDALDIVSRALKTSFSVSQDSPDLCVHKGPVLDNETTKITWVRSSRYLIGIGDRIGNIATMVAFVTNGSGQVISKEQQSLIGVGLTFADQLLHERYAPKNEAKQPKIHEIILRSISFGLAAADVNGELGYMTENFRNWLNSNEELHVLNGLIAAKTPANQTLLQNALKKATTGARKTSVIRFGGAEGSLKTMTVMPISEAPQLALLVFGQKNTGDSVISDQLLETLGLTVAERQLAQQLLSGKSLTAAAKESNLTISTARSYLKMIFSKTGIHRQCELITLCHDLLPPVQLNMLEAQERQSQTRSSYA